MSSFLRKKPVIAALTITAAVALTVITAHFAGMNPVTRFSRIVLSPFRSGISYIADKAYSAIEFIWEMDSYKEENERLNAEITELKKQNRDIAQFREETERLRELLGLQQSMGSISTVAARVIGYSKGDMYDKIEISKGTSDGIAVGNTVINQDGVVGMITETGINWSIVTTIIEADNALGVRITRTGDAAVLEGDEELLKDGFCKMTFINPSINIIAGDIIETSGSADIYPAGLNVGTVRDVKSDSMGQISYATIEPSVDFKSLREVLVINGMARQ